MINLFKEQLEFMKRTQQKPDPDLYFALVEEEITELTHAWDRYHVYPSTEHAALVADGIMDSLYVLAGLANCLYGSEVAERLWTEVHESNLSKCAFDPDTQTWSIHRRDDGKIQKPPSFSPPDLFSILAELPPIKTVQ